MGKFFDNLNLVLGIGLVAALALMMGFHAETLSAEAVLRWLHVFFGITWIGLLYYFNFVQIPTMPAVPAELKPGVSKYIAPKALFYFRWGAAFTVLTGAILAYVNGYIVEALTAGPADRHRHVAGADHGVQRLGNHLAESAEGAWAGRGGRRGQGQGRTHRPGRQPYQHAAVDSHAVCDDDLPDVGKLNGLQGLPAGWFNRPLRRADAASSRASTGRR
jgi:hypothetical protein